MAIDLARFQQLKNKVAALQSAADRAAGARDAALLRLKTEHGCDSLEEAEQLATKLEAEAEAAEATAEAALASFEEEWGERLKP